MEGPLTFLALMLAAVFLAYSGEGARLNPCDFVCPFSLIPVCGSNGDTYDSECSLRLANCRQRSLINITVLHEGPCVESTCEFACPLSLMPVCGSDGETYESECDLKRVSCLRRNLAELTKLHDGKCKRESCEFPCQLSLVPVCGSDGETYDSECDLKKSACRRRIKDLRKVSDGACDSFNRGESSARCEFPCPLSLTPVCGSDGDTYDSECDLKRVACLRRGGRKLTKAHDGPCEDNDSSDSNESSEKCEFPCPLSLIPVCGSDGDTYDSECDLKRVACLRRSGRKLTKAYDGPCEEKGGASNKKAKPCKFACPMSLLPVCGTDGKTYPSECALRKSACKRRMLNTLNVAYKGPCADAKPCEFVCRFSMVPVCGTDGHTYLNECDLKQVACKRRMPNKLAVQHTGPCECDLVFCRYSHTPVCGTDGVTYDNECDLKQSSCRQAKDVSVKSAGKCKTD